MSEDWRIRITLEGDEGTSWSHNGLEARTLADDVGAAMGLLPDSLDLSTSESPRFMGRAVVALAGDRGVARWSGQAVSARDLADEYGFTDVDGNLPAGPLRHRTT